MLRSADVRFCCNNKDLTQFAAILAVYSLLVVSSESGRGKEQGEYSIPSGQSGNRELLPDNESPMDLLLGADFCHL